MLVRCSYYDTCHKQCSAKEVHRHAQCRPCPFNPSAKCTEVEVKATTKGASE